MNDNCILSMKKICKSFFGVSVLEDVQFSVHKGEVRALIGENGAGKSTLMKILAGVYTMDSGTIEINGEPVVIKNPKYAQELGIRMVHQEIHLAEDMTIAENIFLGNELTNKFRAIDMPTMEEKAQELLALLCVNLPADSLVSSLSVAQKQIIEIARAIYFDARIIIMDEPTAALTESEASALLERIAELKTRGIAVIYISHRMNEILKISDSITILRDGKLISNNITSEITYDDIIHDMVGRELKDIYVAKRKEGNDPILSVRHFTNKYIHDISFDLKRGEVLGFYGLMGAGRTELTRAIFGIDKIQQGELFLEGKKCVIRSPGDAIANRLALVPEDRKIHGLVLGMSVAENITIQVLDQILRALRYDSKKAEEIIGRYTEKLAIKMSSPDQHCFNLSGGNQQKVVVAKWLATNPQILILDEPTRGIDVGAKADIYEIIDNLATEGYSILMVSSELPEIMNLSSRIAIMHESRLVKILDEKQRDTTQEHIMYYATGGSAG